MQHDFILLDRSGSMAQDNLWDEALSSVNTYVAKLAEDKVDTGVTLVVFDTAPGGGCSFDIIRDRIIPSTWREVTSKDSFPRNGTPLNDAIGKITSLALASNYDKVAIIIMTDGHENSSRELSGPQAKALLDQCRARGWQVIFLGANFDNAAQAQSYGTQSRQTVNSSRGNLRASGMSLAEKRADYATGTAATMDFMEDEKDKLKAP